MSSKRKLRGAGLATLVPTRVTWFAWLSRQVAQRGGGLIAAVKAAPGMEVVALGLANRGAAPAAAAARVARMLEGR